MTSVYLDESSLYKYMPGHADYSPATSMAYFVASLDPDLDTAESTL